MDEKILSRIRRKLTLDSDFMDDCAAYDAMEAMRWTPPPGFQEREEIRIRVSTDGHDILKTATNLFDVHRPKWEILPRGPEDTDKAEELERWLEWHMLLANRHGDQEPFRLMLKHSTKYNRVAVQLDYLPHWYTDKNSEEYKEALANPFCIKVHNPSNVRYEMGSYGLRWVAPVSNIPAAEAIDHWDAYRSDSKYGKKIGSAIKKIEDLLDEDDEARVIYVDYTDKKKRWVAAYPYDGLDIPEELEIPDDGLIEFVDGENTLGFINWAISAGTSDPLLYSLHHGGLWENDCFLLTMADTTVIRRGWFPYFAHRSNSGKPMEIDFSGVEAVIEENAADGEETRILQPPPLDPGIREMMDRNSQKAASATGLKNLLNSGIAGNVQFATVNAQIQLSKSTLDPYIRNFEKVAVELARLAFMWVKKSGDTLTGYRTKDKNRDKNKVKGEKINVSPKDFDAKTMVIQCELMSITPTDEMQRMNVFSQAVQLGVPISKAEIAERMGWGEADVMKADWLKEQIEGMALGNFQKRLDAMLQLEIQKLLQPPPPAAPSSTPPPPDQMGGANMMPGGSGFDTGSGGSSPMVASPQETQTVTRRPGA